MATVSTKQTPTFHPHVANYNKISLEAAEVHRATRPAISAVYAHRQMHSFQVYATLY